MALKIRRTNQTAKPPTTLIAIACWFDLQEYGRMMEQAGFDPSHPGARKPLARLRAFHEVVRSYSSQAFPTLVMNDGAVAYANIRRTTNEDVWAFILRAWNLYRAASQVDEANGGPGLRAVIAVGLRAKGSRQGIDAQGAAIADLIDRVAQGDITAERAKSLSYRIRRSFDIVPTLQANFAFARAYLAESSGKRAGFLAPNIYLDTKVFRDGVPAWIDADAPLQWTPRQASLATRFVALRGFRSVEDDNAPFRTGAELYAALQCRS